MTDDFDSLLKELAKAVQDFEDSIKGIQDNVLNDIQIALKDLEISGGSIASSVANLEKINGLKTTIENAILNDGYKDSVVTFGKAFNTVASIQDKYFAALVENYSAPEVLAQVKSLAIENTVSSLTESGLEANITDKIRDILKTNIESGSKYKDLVKEIDTFLTDTEAGAGALSKYSSQIATDSINQFSGSYTNIVTQDLGLEWFRYVGALVGDSRELCQRLEQKDFIHKSELPNIVKGIIDGRTIPINKKTGLPNGMIPGTTAQNFISRRGGYRCNHQLKPVSEFSVPKDLREKFKTA